MVGALGTYPYLFANVLWLGGLLLAVRSLPLASHRRLLVRLGLIMIPNCLFSLANYDYWNPIRTGGWALGPEDALFAFNVAAMGCLPAAWLYRHKLIVAEQPVPRIGRLLASGIPAQCIFLVLFCMGLSSMTSAILVLLMAVVSLLVLRPDLWRFSVMGGIGFAPIYCGIVKGVFWIWPGFASCWSGTPPWGVRLFGIPLGEIAWAAGFGLYWPLFAGYVMDLRLSASREEVRDESALRRTAAENRARFRRAFEVFQCLQ